MEIFKAFLIIHVLSGFLSLLGGLIVILVKKANSFHKKMGEIYFYSMFINSFIAIPMSLMHRNYFLLLLSIFTIYLLLSGVRYLNKKKLTDINLIDWILTMTIFLFAFVFICLGLLNIFKNNFFGIVLVFFGSLGLFFAYQDYNHFKGKSNVKNYFLTTHIQRMTGSYIASTTAFLVVNNSILPGILAWILPTIFFVPLIIHWTRKFQVKN